MKLIILMTCRFYLPQIQVFDESCIYRSILGRYDRARSGHRIHEGVLLLKSIPAWKPRLTSFIWIGNGTSGPGALIALDEDE
jgi:hypothetical protein